MADGALALAGIFPVPTKELEPLVRVTEPEPSAKERWISETPEEDFLAVR